MNETVGQEAILGSGANIKTQSRRFPTHTLSDLLVPLSNALDLAEGRGAGHAQRVAYIALALTDTLGLNDESRLASCYAGLFHDIGVVPAGAGLSGLVRGDERLVFATLPTLAPEEAAVEVRSNSPDLVVDRIVDHAIHGARLAHELGLPVEAVLAISSHHEQWDGSGYPHGIVGQEIPIIGRIVSLADQIESLLNQEASPLLARRNMALWLNRFAGNTADHEIVAAARALTAGDRFWLGLFGASLGSDLRSQCARLRETKAPRLMSFAERFSEMMDARFSFTVGISARVAKFAEALGRTVGLPEPRLKELRLAALLHDIGQIGISERIMAKPGILSVEELDELRQHPSDSRDILTEIVGLEDVAQWVACHHERLDGRGYPEGRTDIPLEARILAIADAYVAITSDRPHRKRSEPDEGVVRLKGAAGSQLDPHLVEMFVCRVVA